MRKNKMPFELPPAEEKAVYVNRLFARIAPAYDLVNRLMTGGQDRHWRRELLSFCDLPPGGRLLDVGTGTGEILYEARRRYPDVALTGVDFTYEMIAIAQSKSADRQLPFLQADAMALPFADNTFDAVASGFLLRNVVDREAALREQVRVAKPGGRVVCLETTAPGNNLLDALLKLYFFWIVPLIGGLFSGDREAYTYLPHSTAAFLQPEELAHSMEQAGLHHVHYRVPMFGVAIHGGTK